MKKFNLLLFALLALTSVNGLGWKWAAPLPTGNHLHSIYFKSLWTGYTVGDCVTFIKTTDAGTTWTTLVIGTANQLNSDYFMDNLKGYIFGDSDTIMKTPDGGNLWIFQQSG